MSLCWESDLCSPSVMPGDLSDPSYTKSRRDGARGMQKQSHQFVLMKFFLRTSESRGLERVVVASRALMVNCADQECEQEAHMRVCVCVCVSGSNVCHKCKAEWPHCITLSLTGCQGILQRSGILIPWMELTPYQLHRSWI